MLSRNEKIYFIVLVVFLLLTILVIIYLQDSRCRDLGEKFIGNNKNIFILYTGGTIGMVKSPKGYIPGSGMLKHRLRYLEEKHGKMANYHIQEYEKPLDSSNITSGDWLRIANDINKVYDHYDAFIILHGTDTMAYTASALSFMFETLSKTVIVTGSMISLEETRNDGRNNLITSLEIAAKYDIPEVVIVFDNLILRGNRTTKVNANFPDAFASPNYIPLGKAGVKIEINEKRLLPFPNETRMFLRPINLGIRVAIIKLFPGINAEYLLKAASGLQGIVFELYGIGDSPTNKEFLDAIEKISKSVIMVGNSQCLQHSVNENEYATGTVLAERGVIGGLDMTSEAALAKIYFLLSNITKEEHGDNRINIIRQLINKNLRGELTDPKLSYLTEDK